MSCTPPTAACIDRRQHLRLRGYLPIPLYGKAPVLKEWQKLTVISRDMIELWAKVWPDAHNTGALTRWMPTLDLDITNEDAAVAIEELVREHFSEHGDVLVRIGNPPKRAIPFRTNAPFKKITANLIAPNGNAEKIEFLGDGQQIVVDGIHPETRRPYTWFGGVPWNVPHAELPYIHPHEAVELVDKAAEILITEFNYKPARTVANGRDAHANPAGEDFWRTLIDNILHGCALHDSLRDLTAALIKSGMNNGSTIHLLRALMELAPVPDDERWDARYRSIPRLVDDAVRKWGHGHENR
jgi:hypothetical protein